MLVSVHLTSCGQEHFTSVAFFPKTPVQSLETYVQQTQIEGLPTKYLISPPQNCPGCERQDKLETLGQKEAPKLMGTLVIPTVACVGFLMVTESHGGTRRGASEGQTRVLCTVFAAFLQI